MITMDWHNIFILIIGIYQFKETDAFLDSINFDNSCSQSEFECDQGKCISNSKRCDGRDDCKDAMDEFDCDQYLCREPNFYRCDNRHCIQSSFVCDDENDCGDFSDEKNCTNFKMSSNQSCASDEWMCQDRLCIPIQWVCNGDADCLDASDETLGCSANLDCDGFQCHNGHCVPLEWHCDGNPDCTDSSDEIACEHVYEPKDCTADNRKFLCKNNKTCIDFKLLCDGTPQCPDQSDENIICNSTIDSCSNHNCSHDCVQTPTGPLCLCPKGYHQIADKRCLDINECETYGICDQKCRNTEGSYTCYCDSKYTLQDDSRTCKVKGGEPLMLFSSKTEIRAYFLQSKLYYSVAKKLKQVVGVGFDGNHVYWTDINEENEAIVRSDEDGSNRELLVTSGLGAPEDLAVDWITGNIYFTDALMAHIGVCKNDASQCAVLINEDIQRPRGIVLNPAAGEMYWSDWGKKAEIARSKMDGTEDISFVSKDIRWPNGLTIDYPNQRLYWVDAKLMTIESILLDGTDRRIILHRVAEHPYAIGVFEDKLYWSDWATHSIDYCDKFTGKNHHTMIKEKKEFIYGLHIFHPALKQRTNNPCDASLCSDLCLLSGTSYSCACPEDKALAADKYNCKQMKKKRLLVVGADDMLILIEHQILGKHNVEALPVSFQQINYLTYDSISGAVIVSDKQQQKIISINLETREVKDLVSSGIGQVGGMDFDYYTNNLYWCDMEHGSIEILSLNTMERRTILRDLEGEIPLDLALVPEEGVMFVAFKKQEHGVHIDRIHMDGQGGRTHVVEQGLVGPIVNLIYDSSLQRVFWTDSHTGNIESTSVDGDDRHAFRSLMTEPVSVAILENDLFWSNKNSRRLYWADKHNTNYSFNRKITLDVKKNIEVLQLVAVTSKKAEQHPCLVNNGGCSHLCIMSQKEPICACPLGQILTSDNRTCFAPKHCNADEFKCATTDICIPKSLRCNGKKDCYMGDDEEDCIIEHRCSGGFYECMNGECISELKVCDLHYDCRDKSDEMSCNGFERITAKTCPIGNFRCEGDGRCIAERLVCDNIQDCNDGTDEMNCHSLTCSVYEFRCESGTCVPKNWECDGELDCPDGSDEHTNCGPITCAPGTFTCDNGRCIDNEFHCNFVDDCGDHSDELNCLEQVEVHECKEFEFLCDFNSTICVPEFARCNGTSECPDGEDEKNCMNCLAEEFECNNNKCISQNWICDQTDDCGDKSDEDPILCDHKNPNHTSVVYERQQFQVPCENGFRCKTGHCIDMKMVCNGVENCYDGSDEYGSCDISCEINSNPCRSICMKTPSGPKCGCEPGYKLQGDAQTCQDINECEQHPLPCSQLCENTVGSFTCNCHPGYILRSDRKSCKAIGDPMSVIFTSSNEIRRLSPAVNTLDLLYSEDSPRITGLDMSIKQGNIYFALEEMGSMHRINMKTKAKDYVIGVGSPQKVAVDWITENVYFIDSRANTRIIKACHLKEQKCAKILELDTHDKVSAFVVDAVNKYIFYATTSWWLFNSPTSAIYKCNLDGSKRQELLKTDLGHVTGLAYDYNLKKLYFSDQHLNQIQAIDYDGSGRHMVLANSYVTHPMGLNMFEDHLYFLTPNGYMVKCRIYGEQRICSILRLHAYNAELFLLAQQSKQPMHDNVCIEHNCTHLCIQSEVGVRCVCEDGSAIEEGAICTNRARMAENKEEPRPIFESHDIVAQASQTHSTTGSTISAIVITILFVACAVLVYVYYRSKFKTGKFDISLRFQNPTYGLQDPESILPTNNNLNPGLHEYTNPVLINTHDMQAAANNVIERVKQNPFVLSDSSDSENNENSNKLIRI